MPNWNANFPEVLGLEFLPTYHQTARVWAGAPARMQRLRSTAAETINQLHLSAAVNPLLEASVPTVVDVIVEGNEVVPLPLIARLVPNSDKTNEGWTTQAGSATSLFQSIDTVPLRWPDPTQTTHIRTFTPYTAYACSLNAALFDTGGAAVNGRVFWVGVKAILGANTGFRQLGLALEINGTLYPPAGGGGRDVHGFGAIYDFWWGEINPATGLPWTPADIADFGTAGGSRIFVRSAAAATTAQYPKVVAVSLVVQYATTENRAAVATWRRPEDIGTERLLNVGTDALISLPGGAAGWAKASTTNYLFYWRQSVSPSEYGAVVADDIRWNGAYQDLGPVGQPPGIVYPLQSSGTSPSATGISSLDITHDQLGRPQTAFTGASRATYGLALERSDVAISVDSQPYRLDATDLEYVTTTQKLGQRVVPGSSQTYLGVRFPTIPPGVRSIEPVSGDPTLTVAVFRVSDSVQMGGTFTITASAARALPTSGVWRYITGFLSSGASLVSGTAYEIRVTTSAGGNWVMAVPDSSLGPTASFGGSTNGAFIGATHQSARDLAITLVRQPDPPQTAAAAATNIAATTFSDEVTTVKHVSVTWAQPAVGMGANFARYELERQFTGGAWQRIANVLVSSVVSFIDREATRGVAATYRIRAVGVDGRFSAWATTGSVTLTDTRPMLILASNHRSDLYFVHLYEITDPADAETIYPMLSTEHDEVVSVHGADYQVVFMEAEDRGIGWRTRVSLKQAAAAAKGLTRFASLVALVRSLEVPYVCAMDHQGNRILGHVSVSEGTQTQPDHRYTARLDITPTHTEPVPAEVTA